MGQGTMSMSEVAASGGAGPKPALLLKTVHDTMRALFEVLKDIVHDVVLRVDRSGVRMMTMDGAMCTMVHLRLDASAFEVFECEGSFALGMNMLSMFKLLKTSGSHDTVMLYMDAPGSHELGITIQNAERNIQTNFKLKLLDVDENMLTLPDMEFDNIITMPSVFLQRLCRDMMNLSEYIQIRSDGNRLVLSCEGDIASQETVIGETDAGMSIRAGGATTDKADKRVTQGRFSLKYMTLFCKAASLSGTVELFLKDKNPAILSYNVASLGSLRFVIAPKLDEETF